MKSRTPQYEEVRTSSLEISLPVMKRVDMDAQISMITFLQYYRYLIKELLDHLLQAYEKLNSTIYRNYYRKNFKLFEELLANSMDFHKIGKMLVCEIKNMTSEQQNLFSVLNFIVQLLLIVYESDFFQTTYLNMMASFSSALTQEVILGSILNTQSSQMA